MEIHISIRSEVLFWPDSFDSHSGGVVRFTGVVRGKENGRTIDGLEYEAYQPMAEKKISQILEELNCKHPFHKAAVLHRIGFVPVGEAAILIEVQAAHRGEAFAVTSEFMDRLKQDVPIWKVPPTTGARISGSADLWERGSPVRDLQSADGTSALPFFDPRREIKVGSHWLPHWQQGDVWQFVTWRLADALPADLLATLREEKEIWLRQHPEPWPDTTRDEYHELFSDRVEQWLDAGHGECVLRDPTCQQITAGALRFFDGERYLLGPFVIMPNHVHVLMRPLEYPLPKIVQSWKSHSAREINKHLSRTGSLWQSEYFDRMIRSERHFRAVANYIAENPRHLTPGSALLRQGGADLRERGSPVRDLQHMRTERPHSLPRTERPRSLLPHD